MANRNALHAGGREPAAVELIEVAPRDGLQNEARHLSTAEKLELISRSVTAGSTRIEVTGFARPDVVPALADAEHVVGGLPTRPDVEFSALIVNERSYQRALEAGVGAVNLVVLATDTFSRANQGRYTRELVAVASDVARRASADGVRLTITVGAGFGCPFEGEVSLARLAEVLKGVLAAGPQEIALADTIGVGTPRDVEERFGLLRALDPDVRMRAHFHDTRSSGVANAVAAHRAGVVSLDSSLAGIGGCPFAPAATGNVSTEDLVYCFERMGVGTGLNLDNLLVDAAWLNEALGRQPGAGVQRAGGFPVPDRKKP